jgi:DnaJ-class molecular chaperone
MIMPNYVLVPGSLFRDRHAAHPSFDAMFERLLRNFTGHDIPKAEHAENLTVQVRMTPEDRIGSPLRLGIPTFPTCPVCHGAHQAWPFECLYCGGAGRIEEMRLVAVSIPSRMPSEVQASLEDFGIENFYLTVRFWR